MPLECPIDGALAQSSDYLAASAWDATGRICAQMFQFWRRITSQMTHHQVGREIGSITLPAGPRNVSTSVAFTPDGKNLISATESIGDSADAAGIGHVTEWSFSPNLWSAVACASAGHILTNAAWQQ